MPSARLLQAGAGALLAVAPLAASTGDLCGPWRRAHSLPQGHTLNDVTFAERGSVAVGDLELVAGWHGTVLVRRCGAKAPGLSVDPR